MILQFLMERVWIGDVALVLFGSLILAYGIGISYRHISPRLSNVRIISNKVLFYALYRPLQAFFIGMGIYFLLHLVHAHVAIKPIFGLLPTFKNILVISVIFWFFLRLLSRAEAELIIQKAMQQADIARLDLIFKVLRIAVFTAGTLVLLPMLNVNISGLLAVGGVGGVLAGWMAKDVLGNTMGGLMIYVDRPFSKGDRIRLPERNLEGVVEYIGWRLTVMRLAEQQLLYMPNALFMNIPIENLSRK